MLGHPVLLLVVVKDFIGGGRTAKYSKVPNKRTFTKIASNGLKNGLYSLQIDLK